MASIPRLTPEEVQKSLNRQLIGAIRALDVDRAIRHIKAGADVSGTNALIIACSASLPELALYILAMPDVNLNIKDGRGETPLYLAAAVGLSTVVRVLLEKGAELNNLSSGTSPLSIACANSQKEIAIQLIAAGADINVGIHTSIEHCGNRPEMAEVLAILNSPDPRAAAIKALPVSVPAPNKAELAQQLLRAVQTNNGEEITRLVAAGIRLQDLPKNINTQARLLNAITPRPVAAARAAAPKPVAGTGELTMIDGEFYFVQNGNVYEYDQLMESKGGFVGRLKADESINRNVKEVLKGGSRKTRSRSSKNRKTRNRKH
jgi:hypothetical protein